MNFQKNYHDSVEVVLTQVSLLTVSSKQKIKINTRNIMSSSYHSKVRDSDFYVDWVTEVSIILPSLSKDKKFF